MQPLTVTEPVMASMRLKPSSIEGEQDAEQRLHELRHAAGVAKPSMVPRAALPVGGAVPKSTTLKTGLYRLSKPLSKPQAKPVARLSAPPKSTVECGYKGSTPACLVDNAKRQRDLDFWRRVCAGLKGAYPDDPVKKICTDPRL
jgi:hypothetical protein